MPKDGRLRSSANCSAGDIRHRLPLGQRFVTDLLLRAYLSLAVCREGQGSKHAIYEMVRATYLSYLLWQSGIGRAEYSQFSAAEEALERVSQDAHHGLGCGVDESGASAIARVFVTFSTQLSTVPSGVFLDCYARLDELLRVNIASSAH